MNGFTLVEILVVIVILAVTTAILLPVFAQAREKTHQSTCQSNLRQIGHSLLMYVQDNDDNWPRDGAWRYRLVPGFYQMGLTCPAMRPVPETTKLRRGISIGYAYNLNLEIHQIGGRSNNDIPTREVEIPYPAVTVAVCDQAYEVTGTFHPNPYPMSARPSDQEAGWKRHQGGGNYLFCDGHVKWHLANQVRGNVWPPGNDGKIPAFPLTNESPIDSPASLRPLP